jgi:hypothetical protein
LGWIALVESRIVCPRRLALVYAFRHDGGKKSWPESELLVQADVFRTVCEREKTGFPHSPFLKQIHGGNEHSLRDMLIPQLRADGQRTKEPKTSPVRRKIRPCQLAPMNVPNATRKIVRASGKSDSRMERTETFVNSLRCDGVDISSFSRLSLLRAKIQRQSHRMLARH